MKKRIIKWLAVIVLLLVLITLALTELIGPRMLLIPRRVTNTATFSPEQYALKGEYMTFSTSDSIHLEGYLSHPIGDTKGVMLICHGIGSCKEHQFSVSKFFNSLGYDVLTFDSRAHGQSGGIYCTYGYKEKEDVSAIIDQLEKEGYHKFFIYGQSLGGGIALQSLAHDSRLMGGIIISTFSSLAEVSFDYQKRLTKIPFLWLNEQVNHNAGIMAGFEVQQVNPELACASISQPIFMVHGEKDRRINPDCAHRNFTALKSEAKQLEMIPNGYHNDAWSVGGNRLTEKMIQFTKSHFH